MQRTGSWIKRDTGSEGPSYDPYAYEEITVHRADGTEVTYHGGLAEWVKTPHGKTIQQHEMKGSDSVENLFEHFAGITVEVARDAYFEKKERVIRYHPCGTRELQWVSGFPGESLLHCPKCGHVLDYTFDRSAIE